MAPEEWEEVKSTVIELIVNDFGGELSELINNSYIDAGAIPEQANNEARNFLLHLWRACEADTIGQARYELSQAEWHINVAKRDCIKILILSVMDRVDQLISIREAALRAPLSDLRVREDEISIQIKDAIRNERKVERRHDPEIDGEYLEILTRCYEFEARIRMEKTSVNELVSQFNSDSQGRSENEPGAACHQNNSAIAQSINKFLDQAERALPVSDIDERIYKEARSTLNRMRVAIWQTRGESWVVAIRRELETLRNILKQEPANVVALGLIQLIRMLRQRQPLLQVEKKAGRSNRNGDLRRSTGS